MLRFGRKASTRYQSSFSLRHVAAAVVTGIGKARGRGAVWAALAAVFAVNGCGNSNDAVSRTEILKACSTAFTESTTSGKSLLLAAESDQPAKLLSQCRLDGARNVTIGAGGCGPNVIIDQSFTGDQALGKITIRADGKLALPRVFDRLELHTTGISVAGTLSLGTAACPVGLENPASQVRVVFTGGRENASTTAETGSDKGIEVGEGGTLLLYGIKGVAAADGASDGSGSGVSWTHLSKPAGPAAYQSKGAGIGVPVEAGGERVLHLARDVTKGSGAWRVGDWIVVATSSFSPFESEFVQIESLAANGSGGTDLTVAQALRHYHFGGADPGLPSAANFGAGRDTNYGVDERSEVGLISRNVILTAQTPPAKAGGVPNLHWGGEIRILPGFAEASIQGVELEKFGKDRLASYPIHFHMVGNASGRHLINSNSIHHSYNKCVTVHSSTGVTVQNNVCARAIGHLFYQEMGEEQGSRFLNNLGLGAMSHHFGLADSVPKSGDGLVKNWWEGDNLARANGYDGLNVPNTDNQSNPTHGRCFAPDPNAPGRLVFKKEVPCSGDQLYVEQASGFWIVNPGTVMEGNSIGGCQGMGKGYWYVPPGGDGNVYRQRFEPVGSFKNNRVHACYDGLFGETDVAAVSEQLFPKVGGQPDAANLIAHFSGFTATRIRNRGVWMRPMWNSVEHGRFATNRDAVSLVSSGGNDGNGPGVWALLKDSVLVGVSANNVERWGPCVDDHLSEGDGPGCVDQNPASNELFEHGYQTPRWNSAGYMIYDGPVRIVRNHFVNYLRDPTPLLTHADAQTMKNFIAYPNPSKVYEGDAALGWFQNNQSAYPTATVSRALSFDNVDLRHQIYTEKVNLGDFRDGDMNTAIIDLDGTLTGYQVVDKDGKPAPGQYPISLNNLPFNRSANAVDECLATGQQDEHFEGRATSIISPANMATLEFEALYPEPANQRWQDMVFTKDSPDAGMRQQMRLLSRNGQGIWEPKVASGYGYTVQAAPSTAPQYRIPNPPPQPATGMPRTVHVGFTDAVKPNMRQEPFYVRLGICYSNKAGQPPANNFTVQRGYKSWGGNGVNYNDPELQKYFNFLANRYGGQSCFNLDEQNKAVNLGANGCPAEGVMAVPTSGVCPAGSTKSTAVNPPVCVFPRQTLTSAANMSELTNADGTPKDLNKYYFDSATGMLFFYVQQDADNAHGATPLGSCPGDAACPDEHELDTYYSCPPQGCISYSVQLNDAGYEPGPSNCAYDAARFGLPEPVNTNRLAYMTPAGGPGPVSGTPVIAVQQTTPQNMLHWVPAQAPWCPVSSPPVTQKGRQAANTVQSMKLLLAAATDSGKSATLPWQRWFSAKAAPVMQVSALGPVCSAATVDQW